MTLNDDIRALRQMRLPWWVVLCILLATVLIAPLFDQLGMSDLALPVLCSAAMLGIVIAVKWKLKRRLWFWTSMTVITALHVVLVLLTPWTTKWVPAFVIIPIGVADVYAMLTILSVVERIVQGNP